jgi:hypothetical protein
MSYTTTRSASAPTPSVSNLNVVSDPSKRLRPRRIRACVGCNDSRAAPRELSRVAAFQRAIHPERSRGEDVAPRARPGGLPEIEA